MQRIMVPIGLLAAMLLSAVVHADELTEIIQKDLVALGYDPGNINGELTTDTIVAISKFESENGLEVTGEPSPQLAGIIKARIKEGSGAQSAAAAPANDAATVRAAQDACIQQKIAEAQESQKTKRGLGSLMRAVSRTASRLGGGETAADIARVTRDAYDANATAADLESAAKDLGLTESDIEACRNPKM